jgi:hypothetical protein
MLEIGQPAGRSRPHSVKLGLLLGDALQKLVHNTPKIRGLLCNGFPQQKSSLFSAF